MNPPDQFNMSDYDLYRMRMHGALQYRDQVLAQGPEPVPTAQEQSDLEAFIKLIFEQLGIPQEHRNMGQAATAPVPVPVQIPVQVPGQASTSSAIPFIPPDQDTERKRESTIDYAKLTFHLQKIANHQELIRRTRQWEAMPEGTEKVAFAVETHKKYTDGEERVNRDQASLIASIRGAVPIQIERAYQLAEVNRPGLEAEILRNAMENPITLV